MDPTLGTLMLFAGNFAPRGWAQCEGQLLSINAYQALYSLLGTAYGGDGVSTFGLPDLRGMAPVHGTVGTRTAGAQVADGTDATSPKTLALTWCIALQGVYPSRS